RLDGRRLLCPEKLLHEHRECLALPLHDRLIPRGGGIGRRHVDGHSRYDVRCCRRHRPASDENEYHERAAEEPLCCEETRKACRHCKPFRIKYLAAPTTTGRVPAYSASRGRTP